MQHRHAFEAAERTFKDMLQDPCPFGGLVVCFRGLTFDNFSASLQKEPMVNRSRISQNLPSNAIFQFYLSKSICLCSIE